VAASTLAAAASFNPVQQAASKPPAGRQQAETRARYDAD